MIDKKVYFCSISGFKGRYQEWSLTNPKLQKLADDSIKRMRMEREDLKVKKEKKDEELL
jgi:hypothetical protein